MREIYSKKIFKYILLLTLVYGCAETKEKKPNVLFILMDDLGYGQFGVYNDTITPQDFDPYFVNLVDSLQGYSLEKSIEFSKTAIPTLSTLAKEGVIFNKAYTSSNICAPSRIGMMTGTLQNKYGMYIIADVDKKGFTPGTLLSESFKNNGYRTAHIGKWHIGKRNDQILKDILRKNGLDENLNLNSLEKTHPQVYAEINESGHLGSVVDEQNPLNNGFDYYFGYNYWASQYYNSNLVWENFKHAEKQKGYNTDVFTDKALNFISESVSSNKPFYVNLHYHAVHDSVEPKAPSKYYNKFKSDSYTLNNFFAHVNGVDANVRRIVDFLKSKGALDNTIIIFTSDNGAMAGGAYDGFKSGSPLPGNTPFSGTKGNFYQGGFRVPMFISWPKRIQYPKRSEQLVSAMDILPTAIDAAGLKLPKNIDGKSLLPILLNKEDKPIHDHLIWAGIHSYKWGYLINKSTKTHGTESGFAPPAWVVVKGDYLLRYTGILEKGIYYDYMEGREPIVELFNIKNDPAETDNLAQRFPDIVKDMAKDYFKESTDFKPPAAWKRSKWEELRDDILFQ